MRILIISDTHGNTSLAFRAHTICEPVDAVICLGDGITDAVQLYEVLDISVIAVAGNCDPAGSAQRELVWECEGKKILLTHGDAYGVKTGLARLEQRGMELGVDIICYGHTHIANLETRSGMLIVNPGTLARDANCHTCAVMEITEKAITAHHLSLD